MHGPVTLVEKTVSGITFKLQTLYEYDKISDAITCPSYHIVFEHDGKTWYVYGSGVLSEATAMFNRIHVKGDADV